MQRALLSSRSFARRSTTAPLPHRFATPLLQSAPHRIVRALPSSAIAACCASARPISSCTAALAPSSSCSSSSATSPPVRRISAASAAWSANQYQLHQQRVEQKEWAEFQQWRRDNQNNGNGSDSSSSSSHSHSTDKFPPPTMREWVATLLAFFTVAGSVYYVKSADERLWQCRSEIRSDAPPSATNSSSSSSAASANTANDNAASASSPAFTPSALPAASATRSKFPGVAASSPSAAASSAAAAAAEHEEPEEPSASQPDHASCRACRDGEEDARRNAFEVQRQQQEEQQAAAAATEAASSAAATAAASDSPSLSSPSSSAVPAAVSSVAPAAQLCPPCFAYSHSLCPLNRAEVGRAAWGFLHTLSAYYPEKPSARQQKDMAQLLTLYVKLYPCGYCADRSMEFFEKEPIERSVISQRELAQWMCRMHNEVNERLGKPIFQCEFADQRWRDGPSTGECD